MITRACEPRPGEELRLRRAVGRHRAVVVEMVAREVGEQRDVERDAVDAALVEAVRRHFHRDRARARRLEAREQLVQRAASGVVCVAGRERADEAVAERADDRGAPAAARRGTARSSARTTSCRWCR